MLAEALIGLAVGLMLGLTGAGGGVLAVPLLVLFAARPTAEAIDLSLIGVGAISLLASLRNAWRGELPWRLAAPVAAAAVAGAPLGTWISRSLPETVLSLAFVALSLVVAGLMWRGGCQGRSPEADPVEPASRGGGLPSVLATGAATGILAGLFGVGGGFLLVPALVLAAGQGMRAAAAISLAAITLATASAIGSRVLGGTELPWSSGALLAGAGALAFLGGDAIARRARPCRLKEIFAAVLALILVLMLVHQFRPL